MPANNDSVKSGDERRKASRVPFTIELTLKSPDKTVKYDKTRDISTRGVFVTTDKPLSVGDEGKFEIHLSPDMPAICGNFKVATVSSKEGMGINFMDLDDDSSMELYRVVRYNQPDNE